MGLFATWTFSFLKCLLVLLAYILWLLCILNVADSFCILDTSSLSHVWNVKFLLTCSLSFHLLKASFTEQRFLFWWNLMYQFFLFYFLKTKNFNLQLALKDFSSSVYFPKVLVLLCSTFRSLIHFELIFL